MAIDFRSMADAAKAQYETKQTQAEEERRREKEARVALETSGTTFLSAKVVPLLDSARTDLRKDRIQVLVTQDFQSSNYIDKLPAIEVFLDIDAPGRNDGYRIKSVTGFISSDGNVVHAHISSEHGSRPETLLTLGTINDVETVVSKLFAKLISNFYENLEKYKQ